MGAKKKEKRLYHNNSINTDTLELLIGYWLPRFASVQSEMVDFEFIVCFTLCRPKFGR